ncbi:MAG: phosphoribosylaminoimidazolesuccinocarboxamide synthase [Candidatus Lokiarchaeota archaeon]|nr:phosphoribosylaminoimidazolesuccinocarboxamide synthase [Candidatus Lokiarchaeota archaeon]MBD3201478.1 phosphoribosylaminoimidazolesuccinocarboxamide synthase [Candidatus Lokiarchaeota archaeon]
MVAENIEDIIKKQLKNTLRETNFSQLGQLYRGKVRDNYILEDKRIIVASDRLSAFDRVITTIPFKGQMLNQVSAFWFEKTKDIAKNHLIEVVDPNVSVVQQCETIPIEIIVRAYLTGTAWRNYKKGKATSGISLPEGMKKNQKLDTPLITPSTKAESGHDIYISKQQIIDEKMAKKEIYEQMEEIAMNLFTFGQEYCKEQGLILVDTKYEFGMKDGELIVIDEIHTQDSSRFWILDSYQERFNKGEEPDILDKEIFRGWLMETYPDIFPNIQPNQEIPPISEEIKIELAKRYMRSYERITGLAFEPEVANVNERIADNLKTTNYL